jgi:hypothetical protein
MSTPFWTEDISQLFSLKKGVFPSSSQKLSENMNAIARIALIACLIIAVFKPVIAVSTFVVAMVVTMAIYYSSSAKEGYNGDHEDIGRYNMLNRPQSTTGSLAGASPGSYSSGLAGDLFTATPNFRPLPASEFCTNRRNIPDDPSEYVSENQMLVGGPNRKTLLPIMNATKIRSHDIDAWKTTDLTVHSAINDSNPTFDAATSGYTFFSSRNCTKCSRSPCTCMQFAAAKKMLGKRTEIEEENDLPEVTIVDKATPSMTDIVDPRFSGYGPTDRCYIDPQSGQRKYFYDDVDSIRMPPYISRNNIDVYSWAPKYGAGFDGRTDDRISSSSVESAAKNKGLDSVRQNALDSYRCSTNKARQELQESLMRKRNGEMWQLRTAPIY